MSIEYSVKYFKISKNYKGAVIIFSKLLLNHQFFKRTAYALILNFQQPLPQPPPQLVLLQQPPQLVLLLQPPPPLQKQ